MLQNQILLRVDNLTLISQIQFGTSHTLIASMSVMAQIDGLFPKFLSLARLQANPGYKVSQNSIKRNRKTMIKYENKMKENSEFKS